jgi:hypothetical protein
MPQPFPSTSTPIHYSLTILFFFIRGCGVRRSSLGTLVTSGTTVPAADHNDECGVVGGMRIGRGNGSTKRKHTPVPIFHHKFRMT